MTNDEKAFATKQAWMINQCYYRFNHFCDGTPNKSMGDITGVRPPCPKRFTCKAKETKLYKRLEDKRK